MLALSSLALAAMCFPASPAQAGHWVFSAAGSTFTPKVTGNNSPTLPTWSAPPDSNNSLVVNFPSVLAKDTQTTSPPSCSCTLNAALTITATWTHDAGQTDANDPAPTKVWLMEQSNAAWQGSTNGPQPGGGDDGGPPPASPFTCSGNANDGVAGDQYVPLPTGGPYISGKMVTSTAQATPPPGWSTQNVSGSSFTLTRTLSASGTATYAGPCSVSMTCSFGPYSVKIHAQPYNFHQVEVTAGPSQGSAPNETIVAGELRFRYVWLSTTGDLSQLTSCYLHELVTYPGPDPFIVPAPFSWPAPIPNGHPSPGSGNQGLAMTGGKLMDIHHIWTPVQPYFQNSVSATQVYQFDDTATQDANVTVPGTDATATITRTVTLPPYVGTPVWYYFVTKNNSPASTPLAP